MLIAISALEGYAIRASDGPMGTATDFLFDDASWTLRWIVAGAGTWLTERKLLLHPSSILKPDHERQILLTGLTRAQVAASPPIFEHESVSRHMESRLCNYYGSDRLWGEGIFGADALAPSLSMGASFGEDPAVAEEQVVRGDPHLRSISEIAGCRIHATDGPIGHVEDSLVDDARWVIRYLIVDTRDWWPGKHVLVPHDDVRAIDYATGEVELGLDRDQVRSIPPWDPIAMIGKVYGGQVTGRDGWRGIGF